MRYVHKYMDCRHLYSFVLLFLQVFYVVFALGCMEPGRYIEGMSNVYLYNKLVFICKCRFYSHFTAPV